ncbi:unnamed protein product [Parnassius apollo]|uniref:(apollo) hypothetical protein n=1 Tax=Parnassius apollo TaxID=110799 RepID=A0A8S3X656_PARAO|nr:unnamed protein product [Parnassius apollo]
MTLLLVYPIGTSYISYTSNEQIGTQARTLMHPEQNISLLSSGDTNPNLNHAKHFSNINLNPLDSKINADNNVILEPRNPTMSKPSVKTEDDFDVNEYFARLQGTRYVSAPLNIAIKEEQKTNLGTEEENLEEINLNEPDKTVVDDFQQSITADIAQNFSQLPTVLPQVASAVFSSFSNMLSIKSWEQTPEFGKPQPDYQDAVKQLEDIGVPLMSVPNLDKEMAPPPKEPPIIGTASNYRITTRKKMYAQIPGLTSGDTIQNVPINNSPMNPTNTFPYFNPNNNTSSATEKRREIDFPASTIPATYDSSIFEGPPSCLDKADQQTDRSDVATGTAPDINLANSTHENIAQENQSQPFSSTNIQTKSVITVEKKNQTEPCAPSNYVFIPPTQQTLLETASNVSVIPPPPMFSNLSKKEGQSNVRSVLPPSIARRIAASNPVIKPQTASSTVTPLHNIFIPSSDISTQSQLEQNDPSSTKFVTTLMSNPLTGTEEPVNKLIFDGTPTVFSQSGNTFPTIGPPVFKPSDFSTPSVRQITQLTTKDNKDFEETEISHACRTSDLLVAPLSQLNLVPPVSNTDRELTSNIPYFEETTSKVLSTNISQRQLPSKKTIPPPPVFFNPNTVSTFDSQTEAHKYETNKNEAISIGSTHFVPDTVTSAPTKNLPEPPKISSSHNFRMTKKKPQYYSGPIEGFGSITNNVNVKPTIDAVQTNVFQGSLYTPELPLESTSSELSSTLSDTRHSATPFDLTNPTNNLSSYPKYDVNQSQELTYLQPECNTAFDLSRQTSEYYDQPPQESKGFGIIGSLKSKLSSIDINKIQNTVTTFFDPAYNYTKMEAISNHENIPYDSVTTNKSTHQDQYAVTPDNNLEILVPNLEPEPQTYTGYNYQMIDSNNINTTSSNVPYNTFQYSYFDNQTNNPYVPSTYSNENANKNDPAQANLSSSSWNTEFTIGLTNTQDSMKGVGDENIIESGSEAKEQESQIVTSSFPETNIYKSSLSPVLTSNYLHNTLQNSVADSLTSESKTCIDTKTHQNEFLQRQPSKAEERANNSLLFETSTPCEIVEQRNATITDSLINANFFTHTKSTTTRDEKLNNVDSQVSKGECCKYFEPSTDLFCDSLFSQPTTDESNSVTDITSHSKNVASLETSKNQEPYVFNQNAADFFDSPFSIEKNLALDGEKKSENDLNICETCREVNKPEEKELENLTDQLIENITAPIQLSNPVEVPLTQNNISDVSGTDFEPDQCAEISHITEETIESIHVHATSELLGDVDNTTIIKNYGWCTNDTTLTSSDALLEHDYTLPPVENTIGLFQNKSLCLDSIPTNASDEIKAVYQHSFEDTMTVLPRQISIPTAPPAEDDTKSDESGLDVHSIEQDAKKDFPIFEEYVIEPSETDDDKIVFRERERSSDEPIQDIDTFTYRVERYKKMEETNTDHNDDIIFDTHKSSKTYDLPTSTSPSITIASYFDTGNYAVENYYRNSLTSPSSLNNYCSTAQSSLMRVPPGFEDEFQRKLSLVSNEGLLTSDREEKVKYIHDTVSQSNLFTTLTRNELSLGTNISSEQTEKESATIVGETHLSNKLINVSEEILSPTTAKSDLKLPDFASAFSVKNNDGDSQETLSVFSNVEPENTAETAVQFQIASALSLSDSANFFSTTSASGVTESSDVYDFSRLSSYFSTQTQADPSKSFFELSQSQNHYRQSVSSTSQRAIENISKYANLDSLNAVSTQSKQNNVNDIRNIPNEAYIANVDLMKDLTSTTNIDFIPKEQTIRSVNFFTVEYDNNPLKIAFNNESKLVASRQVDNIINNNNESNELTETSTDADPITIIEVCSHCCNKESSIIREIKGDNLDGIGSSNYKFRKLMDKNNSETNKDIDVMENKKEVARGRSATVNFDSYSMNEDKEDSVAIMTENRSVGEYSPVKHHWFYCVDYEGKSVWKGFSAVDSTALENAFVTPDLNENTLVPTDGGRFDVNVVGRLRMPVYWSEKPTDVLRCSWFYKGTTDARYVPYSESVAEKLEEEYKHGITTGEWHRRLTLPNGELVVMHGPAVMVHFLQSGASDAFSSSSQSTMRPRVVRRGCVESEMEESEPSKVDHLLLLCHGVGSACDMKFRPVEEVVDDFRATSLQLLQSHYKNSYENGVVGKVEVLPISWHSTLHSGERGVDKRLAQITLDSIPRLRNFTNDTVLDVLFYTSPVFCQTIIDTEQEQAQKQFVSGTAGTGQPTVKYPRLQFNPDALYALGSPIAIFECIRGVELLGPEFCLPTCKRFFNIFHPYDPIAYRIEPLINPELRDVKPLQIPHHKGRKRMHLELKDTMARVGADIKQKLLESIKNTWSVMWKTQPPPTDQQLEKVVEEEMEKEQLTDEPKEEPGHDNEVTAEMLGKLNDGRRIDYVLQEAPIEMINEYLFAMSSHACYWESEDTMLLMLREIYEACGVQADGCVPMNTMTVQRTRPLNPEDSNVADYPSTSRGGL